MGIALGSLNPPISTYGGICTDEKNTDKFYFYLQQHTTKESGLWTEFLASPDLERSLTKTKKELRQAPATQKYHAMRRGICRYIHKIWY